MEILVKNGFDNSDSNVTVTINYPYTWQGVSGYVEAIVSENVPTYFARVFNQNDVTVRSRAVAGLGNYASGCVIALDPSVSRAMVISGTVDFDVNCEIEVHSDNPDALRVNGSAPCVQSGGIGAVGGYTINGNLNPNCFDPAPVGGMMYSDDPISKALADGILVEPDATTFTTCDYVDTSISTGTVYLAPGYYCGSEYTDPVTGLSTYNPAIRISGGNVYLANGIYYLDSGLSMSGGTLTHDPNAPSPAGVLLYNTNLAWAGPPANPDHWDEWRVTGNSIITLSGYQSSPHEGALLWEASYAPTFKGGGSGGRREHVFSGTATLNLSGYIYAPQSEVAWRGTNDTLGWFMVVANTVEMSGTPFGSGGSFSSGIGPPIPFLTVTMVE